MQPTIGLIVLTAILASQPLPLSTPDKEGLSRERLARLHQRFDEMVREGKKAGAITMIVRNGRIADWKAYGYRDVAQKLPHQYIPELKGIRVLKGGTADNPELVDTVRPVTVKHLMTHTSGLTYSWGDHPVAELYRRRKIFENGSLKEFVARVARLPLVAQPGEKFNYGINTDVLGYLVEVVSGMPFDRFVQSRILAPLGMHDTFFEVPKEKLGRVAKTYTSKDGKLVENPPEDLVGKADFTVPYGGMGLYSTIGDYARFGQMLLNGGHLDGARLLGRKTVELMTLNHLNDLAVPHTGGNGAYGFGLGGSVRVDLARGNIPGSLGQFGWDGAAMTHFRMDPKERTVALVFFQHMPFDPPTLELFSTLFYQAIVD